ncbi:hypothetical protein D3C80_1032190 [compost metagenome]
MFNAIFIQPVGGVNRQELIRQLSRKRSGQRFTHSGDGNGIDDIKQLSDFVRGRQRENFCGQRRIDTFIKQNSAECIGNVHRQRQRLALLMTIHVQLDVGRQQALRRIPTGEIVTRMTHQERQLLIAPFVFQFDRCREFTQQRRNGLEVDVIKDERLLSLGNIQNVMHRMAAFLQRDHFSFVIVKLDTERNMQRMFFFLLSRRRRALADGQRVLLGFWIVIVFHGDNRRPGLAVPAAEMRQVNVRRVFHGLHEVIAGGCTAIVTLKVQLHPFLEVLFAQQRMDHTNNFRTLFIHRQGVEVVHFDHFIRTNRVRHWAGVFSKLQATHGAHVADAVNSA